MQVAIEAKYHSQCLVKLYNASSRKIEEDQKHNPDGLSHGIALTEMLGYIEDIKVANISVAPIFKLIELVKLYMNRLQELGVEVTSRNQIYMPTSKVGTLY